MAHLRGAKATPAPSTEDIRQAGPDEILAIGEDPGRQYPERFQRTSIACVNSAGANAVRVNTECMNTAR